MEENPIHINPEEEAEFIKSYLAKQGVKVTTDLILMITDAQFEYMKHLGLVGDPIDDDEDAQV